MSSILMQGVLRQKQQTYFMMNLLSARFSIYVIHVLNLSQVIYTYITHLKRIIFVDLFVLLRLEMTSNREETEWNKARIQQRINILISLLKYIHTCFNFTHATLNYYCQGPQIKSSTKRKLFVLLRHIEVNKLSAD